MEARGVNDAIRIENAPLTVNLLYRLSCFCSKTVTGFRAKTQFNLSAAFRLLIREGNIMAARSCSSCGYLIVNFMQPCKSCGAKLTFSELPPVEIQSKPRSQPRCHDRGADSRNWASPKMIAVILSVALVLFLAAFFIIS